MSRLTTPAGGATALRPRQWRAWAVDVEDRRVGRRALRSVTLHVAPAASFSWTLGDSAQAGLFAWLGCQLQLATAVDLLAVAGWAAALDGKSPRCTCFAADSMANAGKALTSGYEQLSGKQFLGAGCAGGGRGGR